MKKKILFAVIAIIAVIGIVAGIIALKGTKNSGESENENSESNIEQVEDTELIYLSKILSQDGEYIAMVSNEGKQFRYKVEEATFDFSEDISIKIPQLIQMEGDNITFANFIIQDTIAKELEAYKGGGKISLSQYDYEITLEGNQIISIIFTGNINVEGAAHPNSFIVTLNIDLLTANLLDTTSIIENREELIKLLKSDKAEVEGIEEAKKYIRKDIDDEVLMSEVFEKSKKIYFTPEHICTVISVPHAIGDYAVVKLKYSELK